MKTETIMRHGKYQAVIKIKAGEFGAVEDRHIVLKRQFESEFEATLFGEQVRAQTEADMQREYSGLVAIGMAGLKFKEMPLFTEASVEVV